jgi:GAF domain-containing protein
MGRGAKPAKVKVEARPPVARKSRKVEGSTGRQVEQRLAEALEQQAATSEVLKLIGRSTFDLELVFKTLAKNAARLCAARRALIFRFDGQLLRFAVGHNVSPKLKEFFVRNPIAPGRGTNCGRAALERRTVHNVDVLADPEYSYGATKVDPYRTVLAVPMLKGNDLLGVICIYRQEVRAFTANQIALMETFANQAVIAIENVRLFTELGARNRELTEALEQQTSTSEILRVISQSPTDVKPVFDTIAAAALKLCSASAATVGTFDGQLVHLAAMANISTEGAEALRRQFPRPPSRGSVIARAIFTRDLVVIPDVLADADFAIKSAALASGFRSAVGVPLMRDGAAIGAISVGRPEPGPFPEKQIALLKTFADQAMIAIENVRLFKELEARNRDLTEALEQQTATSGILRVISRSPTALQPVFDAIVRSANELCDGHRTTLVRLVGEEMDLAAVYHARPRTVAAATFPRRLERDMAVGRAILDGALVHIPDVKNDPEYPQDLAQALDVGSALSVPLMRDGKPIGAIGVSRATPGPFPENRIELLKTFADQAVIAIENVRLFTELEARNRDLTEALEQQTATSDILRVISQSQTDAQPVFDTIAAAAMKLCRASSGNVVTFDGELIHIAALAIVNPEGADAVRRLYPRPPGRDTAASRAVLTGRVVAIPDVLEEPEYAIGASAVAAGFRSVLAVPLMRERNPIGAILVGRPEPAPFPDKQIALLQTFADQAVIAIENVRLFNETKEALERQTATAEVLKVISESPTDVQPVFDAIAERAKTLCGAYTGAVTQFDGELVHLRAFHGASREAEEEMHALYPMKLGRGGASTRAIVERAPIQIADIFEDPDYSMKNAARSAGFRSLLAVPMLREGEVIGSIVVSRAQPGIFAEKLVTLLQTFADQAVIAIENVRLFTELQARNQDLTIALDQKTATSEILRVISQSQTDVQPVFDAIVRSAVRLCGADHSIAARFDGELLHPLAHHGFSPEALKIVERMFPMRPGPENMLGRAALSKAIVNLPDMLADPMYSRDFAMAGGWRSGLGVPMLRDGELIGAIAVSRTEPGTFPDHLVALLTTFADQAVIAIENVRLFTELESRTTELTQSVGELTALGEVGQAVSSTLDLGTVLRTIVSRATQLAGMDGGAIYEYDETREQFYLHATDKLPEELVETLRAAPIPKGEGALGRMAVTGEPTQIGDIADEASYQSRLRAMLIRLGYRSLLAVPLLREDHLLGGLVAHRKSAGEFTPQVIDLLKTFATQSALAIQNARLFREIEEKSRLLETASRHKSEFLANMSHELRTPLNAIIGFSEVLSERMFGEINDKQAEYLSDILESGRHLLSLINDILDLSKIEAGRMELEPSEFDLPSAIENTLILVRERAQRRGITLGRTVDERLAMIRADERKVKQVLLNLLSNALKFTPEGGQIEVRARVHNGEAEISVADTGVGIAPEDQEAVFEEFRQVGATARKVEGTGLGLAISRKFIELHGGRIWVDSQVGMGSTFAFTLPLTIDQCHPTD